VAYLKSAIHGVYFLFRQFTSAQTAKHPIILIHICSPFLWLVLQTRHLQTSGRAIRLTANLTDVLISIRRRRGGAE
jgi:hypothetical protein